jgi:nucleoside-diphosphate-sugar epimerase
MSVLVTGATSQVGSFLLPRLVNQGLQVHAMSRTPPGENDPGVLWHLGDIENGELPIVDAAFLIHLAPLPLLPRLLPSLIASGFMRVIAFGSTSRFSKQNSSDAEERDFALQLVQAEREIASCCEHSRIPWTVFRPTLIYGCGKDRNITVIAKFIRRFGFFPLLGETKGLRQPVHADDLALACLSVLDNPAAFNRAYDLSGGETLSYRQMVERIFEGLGKSPKFLPAPLLVFQALMKIASLLPRYRYLSGAMARRMNEDLYFDHAEASRDFGYSPRGFRPNADDLTPRGFHVGNNHLGRLPKHG